MRLGEGSVGIVVPSCDAYSDLWKPFFQMLQLRWPKCPFQIYLVTNQLPFASDRAVTISVGKDLGWSANLLNALTLIREKYVLLFMDDLFLQSDVNDDVVVELIRRCVGNEWDYLRLNPTPGPPRVGGNGGVGRVPPGDWYRTSTVLSLWKKAVLLEVLEPHENVWELEIFGGTRTDKYNDWFACERWNLPFYNLVIKGKIDPLALSKIEATGLQLSTTRRVMNSMEVGLFALRRGRSWLMNLVPRKARRSVRALFASH